MSTVILVVEDDDEILKLLRNYLQQKGYIVITSSNGEEGLLKAREHHPDAIILDIMLPQMDGWAVARTLRSEAQFVLTPIVFLSALQASQHLIESVRLGILDYVTKPFQLDDVLRRVEALLTRRKDVEAMVQAQQSAAVPGTSALRSDLSEVGLPSLLSLMSMERRSGVLRVSHEGDRGLIHMSEGRLLRASVLGRRELEGREAVFHLLGWKQGEVEYRAQPVSGPDEIAMDTTHLVIESARRNDENNRN